MTLIYATLKDFLAFFNLKKTRGRINFIILLALTVIAIVFLLPPASTDETQENLLKTVFVSNVSSLTSDSLFSIIGSVASQNQARIQTEAAGRVTSVPVKLGDNLRAGQVIATLENASEYAAVLQAEGIYESALAAASLGDVSVESAANSLVAAQNNAVSSYNSSYATLRTIFSTDLDEIIADPDNTFRTPRLKLLNYEETQGRVDDLYAEMEVKLKSQLQITANTKNVSNLYLTAIDDVNHMLSLVNLLSVLIADDDKDKIQKTTAATYLATLSVAEKSLISTKSALEVSQTALATAQKGLKQAQIGSTKSEVSTANAQIKQALGALRAAEANYAKTVIRTPIAGTLNELSVEAGDFVGIQSPIALVANNNALQITAFVGEQDQKRMSVGQSVLIENSIPGIITQIAPALDSVTKKFEVKIGTDDQTLTNGDTVTVSVLNETDSLSSNTPLLLPLTAVKFSASDGSVFFVVDGKLTSRPVKIGSVRGSFIEVTDGIDAQSVIVVDARGLTDGQLVEAVEIN